MSSGRILYKVFVFFKSVSISIYSMHPVSNIFNKTHLQGSLPSELQDYVFSFCEGYERADLGIRSFALPVRVPTHITTIGPMLELNICTISRSDEVGATATFVEKKNTDSVKGYVSKMVKTDSDEVLYTWIKVMNHN
jgi:hypothetical protein